MKSWRSGFIRCRIREGPCGSHQVLARDAKCLSSAEETEEEEEEAADEDEDVDADADAEDGDEVDE